MKIVVVGLGYVGLSNAVLLAQNNEVIGIDILSEKVAAVNSRKSPILDLELSIYLEKRTLNLSASMDLKAALPGTDYVIVSTPTNYDEQTNNFDTSLVESVISQVTQMEPKACIVVKSTVPVGFTERINTQLGKQAVVFSPEFLREGSALYDNLNPSRIIVGENSQRAADFAYLLQQGAVKKNIDVIFTGSKEAEAIKLFSNTYLAMRVAFFNELDSYSLAHGLESADVINGVSCDPRIGKYYNNPSFGYGGYCLPKDTKQLLVNYELVPQNLIKAIVEANATRKDFLATKIIEMGFQHIGIYRLVMKFGSDNFRESSVWGVMSLLKKAGIKVTVYEPELKNSFLSGVNVEDSLEKFKEKSELIVTNRMENELDDVKFKVFTRDIFFEN